MNSSDKTGADPSDLDQLAINTLRFLSVDAIEKANSGHPGLPMGAAPMAYVLWTRFLRHNPENPRWWNRDRFVLSAGHGSMLLYSLLHLTGYDLPLEQIKHFRQWGSITPGHPERGLTPGVEVTTGPLGQGFANAAGMAIAEAHLAARFNRPGHPVVSHYTYALVGDGDLMEGVSYEAASLAGHLKLGKLICLYDDNRITLAAATDLTFTEDRAARFDALGWHTQAVEDGNDLDAIDGAIRAAQAEAERPSLILVRTHIGYGSPNKQDTFEAHGSPLGEDEVALTKRGAGLAARSSLLHPRRGAPKIPRGRGEGEGGRRGLERRAGAVLPPVRRSREGAAAGHGRRTARRLGRGCSGFSGRCQGDGDPRGVGQDPERPRPAPPAADGRLGRSGSLHPDRPQGNGRFRGSGGAHRRLAGFGGRRVELRGAQPALRRARARHGVHRERARGARRRHPLHGHVSHLLGLYASADPAGGAHETGRGFRLHPRQHRSR